MSPVEMRLATWSALAVVALGFTVFLVVDNWRNWQAAQEAVRQQRRAAWGAVWWVALDGLVSSVVMVGVWAAIAAVGLLGFYPPLFEYRGWGQLVAVTLLFLVQVGRHIARVRVRAAHEQ